MAEELWEFLHASQNQKASALSYAPWPVFDPALAKDDFITVAVQVLGKTRGTLEVDPEITQAEVELRAKELSSVQSQIEGKAIKKVIYVKGKIVNFVTA